MRIGGSVFLARIFGRVDRRCRFFLPNFTKHLIRQCAVNVQYAIVFGCPFKVTCLALDKNVVVAVDRGYEVRTGFLSVNNGLAVGFNNHHHGVVL